jgi:hypothetical protein
MTLTGVNAVEPIDRSILENPVYSQARTNP